MLDEVGVDRKVARDVIQVMITIAAPAHVIIASMEQLVPDQEFDLLGLEGHDKPAVVIEVPAVSGGSLEPLVGIDKPHARG